MGSTSRLRSWAAVVAGAGVVGLAAGSPAWADNAACPGAQSSTATSCTFTTAGIYTFTAPAGVSSVDVVAVGAAGGYGAGSYGAFSSEGGSGASVEDTAVPVSAQQPLSVVVGGVGGSGNPQVGGAGGTPGNGGAGGDYPDGSHGQWDGAGGGGFSGVLVGSNGPLVIAAGGGGGSLYQSGGAGDIGNGGGAGDSAVNGGSGGGGAYESIGGSGGSGADGAGDGEPGAFLTGGAGGASNAPYNNGLASGSGGGGGFAGGGGGGGGAAYGSSGGGGSSYGVTGLVNEMTATTAATVTISFGVSVSVSCDPPTVSVNQASSCTATVTDVSGSATPAGTVTFSTTDPGGGFNYGNPDCILSGSGASASCSVTFTASQGDKNNEITASYPDEPGGQGQTALPVFTRDSVTTLSCAQTSLALGQSTTCTATVYDYGAGGPASAPTGHVRFTPTSDETFTPDVCDLTAVNGDSSSCSTSYTPTAGPRTHVIAARYGGSEVHHTSITHLTTTVTNAPKNTT